MYSLSVALSSGKTEKETEADVFGVWRLQFQLSTLKENDIEELEIFFCFCLHSSCGCNIKHNYETYSFFKGGKESPQ